MTQEERFRVLARNSAAKARQAGTPAMQAQYVRLAAIYDRVADAYAIKPSARTARTPDAVLAARIVATPGDTRSESRALRELVEASRRQLLVTMRTSAQLHRRYRELEFETELALLARGIS